MTNVLRILLTGGSGFLGSHIIARLANKYQLWATMHTSPLLDDNSVHSLQADMETPGALAHAVRQSRPDVVIHAAALTNTAVCENKPELAHRINVESTREILDDINPAKTRFIFVSTDLVFDGLKGFYNENDAPNPKMVYAETKVTAERIVQSWGHNYVILRAALMYGESPPAHPSFLGWLKTGLESGNVTLFADEFRTPLFVANAADIIERLMGSNFCGIMHIGGAERCSRYDFGVEFARQGGYAKEAIRGIRLKEANLKIYRPPDVSLDSSLAEKVLGVNLLNVAEGLSEYFAKFKLRG